MADKRIVQLLAQARSETEKPRSMPREYFEVIRVLREEKRFKWKEVHRWLIARGVEITEVNMYQIYKRDRKARRENAGNRPAVKKKFRVTA